MPRQKGRSAINPIDARVGDRIRARRLELGLSQTALGDQLGVTFQQVQKYEKGRNRVGAGRLTDISRLLKVHPTYFFEESVRAEDEGTLKMIDAFAASKEGMDLIRAMTKIRDDRLKSQIARLVAQVADTYYE